MLTLATGIGEWVSAYVFFALAFLVATVGVMGLGIWVLRGDARNRRARLLTLRDEEREENQTE